MNTPTEDIGKVILSCKNKGTNNHGAIYIPTKYRGFFPDYGKGFTVQTKEGNILTHMTLGGYFTKGMQPWFRKHKLTADDNFIIEMIEPMKIYSLKIEKGK